MDPNPSSPSPQLHLNRIDSFQLQIGFIPLRTNLSLSPVKDPSIRAMIIIYFPSFVQSFKNTDFVKKKIFKLIMPQDHLPIQCTEAPNYHSPLQKCKNSFLGNNSKCHQKFQSGTVPRFCKSHLCHCPCLALKRNRIIFSRIKEIIPCFWQGSVMAGDSNFH